jgi:hypothetical protein
MAHGVTVQKSPSFSNKGGHVSYGAATAYLCKSIFYLTRNDSNQFRIGSGSIWGRKRKLADEVVYQEGSIDSVTTHFRFH